MKKTSSSGGQDLRMPALGGTKFPTKDSHAFSRSLLRQSQNFAEKGPTPSMNQTSKQGPTFKDMTPDYGTTKGDLPTFKGASMDDKIANDPLVQYLRKQAQAAVEQPMPVLQASVPAVDESYRKLVQDLGTNAEGMNPPAAEEGDEFTDELLNIADQHQNDTLAQLFDNAAKAHKLDL